MNNDFRQIWENIFQISQAVFRVTHLFPKDEILRRHLRAKITEILYQSSRRDSTSSIQEVESREIQPRASERLNLGILISEIHNFRSLLFTAKNCNFVDEKNIIILIKECENLLEKLDKFSACHSRESGNPDFESPDNQIFIPQNIKSLASMSSARVYSDEFPQPTMSLSPRRQSRPLQTMNHKLQTDQSDIGFFIPNIRQQKILDYFKRNNKGKIHLKDVADEFKNITPRTVRSDLRELCDNGHLIRNGNGAGSFYCMSNNAS